MPRTPLLALLILIPLLQGCTPLLVGGVVTGAALIHDRRTAGTVLDDQGLEFRLADVLDNDPQAGKQAHVSATAYNGMVLLTGEAPTESLRDRIQALAGGVRGIRHLYNEVRIAEPGSLWSRGQDSLLTGRVKTALLEIDRKGFDPSFVKVVSNDSVVYLMGLLTPAEADAVVEQARRVRGVKRVVRIFELRTTQ